MCAMFALFSMQQTSSSKLFGVSNSAERGHLCKNLNTTTANSDLSSEIDPHHQNSTATTNSAGSTYSCSISLQMMMAQKQKLYVPQKYTALQSEFDSIFSSQLFAFQEPDPPQIV